ncbi:unnamed protein product [Effrenium voratum]|nr:unnamed protein product [Effrenium voratum]
MRTRVALPSSPELPEVEYSRRCAQRALASKRISAVKVANDRVVFEKVQPKRFAKLMTGRKVKRCRRWGKQLWFEMDKGPCPTLHLGMTGSVHIKGKRGLKYVRLKEEDPNTWPPRFCKLELQMSDGTCFAMSDPRRFGRIRASCGAVVAMAEDDGAEDVEASWVGAGLQQAGAMIALLAALLGAACGAVGVGMQMRKEVQDLKKQLQAIAAPMESLEMLCQELKAQQGSMETACKAMELRQDCTAGLVADAARHMQRAMQEWSRSQNAIWLQRQLRPILEGWCRACRVCREDAQVGWKLLCSEVWCRALRDAWASSLEGDAEAVQEAVDTLNNMRLCRWAGWRPQTVLPVLLQEANQHLQEPAGGVIWVLSDQILERMQELRSLAGSMQEQQISAPQVPNVGLQEALALQV